jgi:hypothetical protein
MNASALSQQPARKLHCLNGGKQRPPAPADVDFDLVIEDLDNFTAAITFPTGSSISDYAVHTKIAAIAA